jgi:DNA polymerase III delta prime subunit
MLAEKYRPQTFDKVIGQDKVIRAMRHYLDNATSGMAFLLTGPSGSGKTTLAECAARYWGVADWDIHRIESAECDVAKLRELASNMLIYVVDERREPFAKIGPPEGELNGRPAELDRGQDPEQRDGKAGEAGLPALCGALKADQNAVERIVALDIAACLRDRLAGEEQRCRSQQQQDEEGSACFHGQKPLPSPVLMASRPEVTKLR